MHRFQGVGAYATVGLDFALAVVIGFLGGRWLDNKLGTHGWLTVIGFVFGVAAGFNLLWKAARRMREETEREDWEAQRRKQDWNDRDGNHGEH